MDIGVAAAAATPSKAVDCCWFTRIALGALRERGS
jgi:hypothetical protein